MSGNNSSKLRSIYYAAVGVIGFLLSPLSWWNDILVNVPLAYLFACLIGWILSLFTNVNTIIFTSLAAIGYLLTNVLGFLMLHYSAAGLVTKQKISIKSQIIVSLLYTAAVVLLIYFDVIKIFSEAFTLYPGFVK